MAKKVLIVEDSHTMRSLISETICQMKGYETVEAQDGFEALKALPTVHFDLIITDINMPYINGLEVVNFVKANPLYHTIPLIIVSTEREEEDIRKGLSLGASAYVTKPFAPDDLRKVVRKVLKTEGER